MSQEKICPTCGTEYPANERFCPRDGSALRAVGGSSTDLVGSIIAERYHILKKLGEGGMGQVYLAEHVKMGRKSAVKVMNPGMVQDADAISRFNREAANASRIPSAVSTPPATWIGIATRDAMAPTADQGLALVDPFPRPGSIGHAATAF